VEEPTIEAGRAGMARLLAEGCDFTGLICFNDLIAMGTIEQAQTAGLDVPGQLSVVGFDDVSDDYNFQPALSSVRFDRLAMGRRAVQLICETVEFRKIASRPRRKRAEVFPVKLIVRHSSSPYAKQK
jgi:LacI family transcriptional regulator